MDALNTPFAGVIFGLFFGFLSAIGVDLWRERRLSAAVRTMLALEINRNIATLRDIATKMAKEDPNQPVEQARQLAQFPLNGWESTTWTEQNVMIPRALSTAQIIQVSAFYSVLDEISGVRAYLKEAFDLINLRNTTGVTNTRYSDVLPIHYRRADELRTPLIELIPSAIALGVTCSNALNGDAGDQSIPAATSSSSKR